ncbi:MAG: tandem-95 repeat protein [Saprospiraceae bacterium]|nr:tandem-95 repeat protein [Saprospiraceae bacterium]
MFLLVGLTAFKNIDLSTNKYKSENAITAVAALETLPAGTWIIAMDNNLQSTGSDFNVRAYGLAVHLLHANIPLRWIINSGKAKDGIDFTARASRIFPNFANASNRQFRSGPIAIYPGFESQALSVIDDFNALGSPVQVYQLEESVEVEIYADLMHKPKAGVLDNGGNQGIHEDILVNAGFIENEHYVLEVNGQTITAADVNAGSCYTFISEAHADEGSVSAQEVANVMSFLQAGGNFLAQCAAGRAYENLSVPSNRLLTLNGVTDPGIGGNIIFDNPADPYMQIHGALSDEGGSAESYRTNQFKAGTNVKRYAYDSNDGINYKAFAGRVANPGHAIGGYAHYLAGHSYGDSGEDKINGRRMYLNALLTPAFRPDVCNLVIRPIAENDFGTIAGCEDEVTIDVVANDVDLLGRSLTVNLLGSGLYGTFTNNGDGTVTYAPNTGYWPGIDSVQYESCNPDGICHQATIFVELDANNLVMDGLVFADMDRNGAYTPGETGEAGISVNLYKDINGDGLLDAGDQLVVTSGTIADGSFQFTSTDIGNPSTVQITNRKISASTNDSYEKSDGKNHPAEKEGGTIRYRGYRFPNLNIPSNAIITNATLTFVGKKDGEIPVSIKAEKLKSPGVYSNANDYLATRAKTSNTVNWDLPKLINGGFYTSPNFKAVVQEVVNSQNGVNHLSVLLSNPTGSWESFNYDDGTSANYPYLDITFIIPPDPVTFFINIDPATIPLNEPMITPNIHTVTFTGLGQMDCGILFGYEGNNRPDAIDDATTTREDTPVSIDVLNNDDFGFDGPSVGAIQITGAPSQGTVIVNDNGTPNDPTDDSITYTPNTNYNGNDYFFYQICDVDNDCDIARVDITIYPDNDVPTPQNDSETTTENTPVNVGVTLNDSFGGDGPSSSAITIVSPPANGVAVVNDNGTPTNPRDDSIDYTPNANYNGIENFTYQICDANGDCASANVTITIQPEECEAGAPAIIQN